MLAAYEEGSITDNTLEGEFKDCITEDNVNDIIAATPPNFLKRFKSNVSGLPADDDDAGWRLMRYVCLGSWRNPEDYKAWQETTAAQSRRATKILRSVGFGIATRYRRAKLTDIDQIYDLYQTQRDYVWIDHQPSAWTVDKNDFGTILDYLYVAKQNEKVIGFVLAYDMRIWAYVEILVLHKEHRGQYHMNKLLDFVAKSNPRWRAMELCYDPQYENIAGFLKSYGFDEPMQLSWVQKRLDDPAQQR